MSLLPCNFFDLRSGKPVLIGDFEAAKQWLVDNPEVMVEEAPKQATPESKPEPKTESKQAPKITSYSEVYSKVEDGTGIKKSELEEELPYFLNQLDLAPLNERTKPKKANEIFQELLTKPKSEILEVDSPIAKKMGDWVESQQAEYGVKPMSLAERLKAWTQAQRDELKEFATSGGVLYKALLDAIDLAVDAAVKANATAKEINAAIKKAIDDFRSEYKTNQRADAEKAIAYLQKGGPTTVRQQIDQSKAKTKGQIQRAINAAFDIGMGFGKQEGFQKGATQGMKAGDQSGRETAVRTLKAALTDLKADLNPRQINALLDRMARIKRMTPESMQRFIDYANKVVDDANYVLQERAGLKIKNRVKALSQSATTTGNDQNLFAAFANLSISHMEPDVLQEYIDWGTKIVGKTLKDRAALEEFITDQKQVQEQITKARSDKSKATREQNQKDEYDRLKKEGQLPDGVTTFEEYQESVKPKSKAETQEQKVARVTQQIKDLEIPEGTDKESREVLESLKKQDLSQLSADDLELLSNSINNFEDTGELYAAGDIAAKAFSWSEINKLVESDNVFNKQVDPKDAKNLSLTNIFNKFLHVSKNAAKVRGAIIQAWLGASTKAYKDYVLEEKFILKKAKELGLKLEQFNRVDLFGFLNEAEGNPELFEALKNQKLSDLKTLKELVDRNIKENDKSESAKYQQIEYETLKESIESLGLTEASTLGDIKISPKEKQLYDYTRSILDKYAPAAIRNMALYGNKEVGIIKNYWPRNAIKTKNEVKEETGNLEDFSAYNTEEGIVGKKLFGRQKGRTQLIGKNGYYQPDGKVNLFNGLRETMMIAYAAKEYHQMQAVYNSSKGIGRLIRGKGFEAIKKYMVNAIQDTKNHGRYNIDTRTIGDKAVDHIKQAVTSGLIKNFTQLPKQLTALAYPLFTAPKSTYKAAQILTMGRGPDFKEAVTSFVENGTLGVRLSIPEIIDIAEKYSKDTDPFLDALDAISKVLDKAGGGDFIMRADKAVSVVSTLAGYIQYKVQNGDIKDASEFDIVKENEKGWDVNAMAAGEQMQGKTNNENTRLLFSQNQKDNPNLYFLTNFTKQAVQTVYESLSKIRNPTTSSKVKADALRSIAGTLSAMALFQGVSMLVNGVIQDAYQKAFELASDDDDEEKKRKRQMMKDYEDAMFASKRDAAIINELVNLGVGTKDNVVQMIVNYGMAAAFEAYQYIGRNAKKEGTLPEYLEKSVSKEYNPFFADETVGQAGAVTEAFVKPLVATAKDEDPWARGLQEAGILALKLAKMPGPAYFLKQEASASRNEKKAEKFADKTLSQQSKTIYKPENEAQERAKEQFRSAIETGNPDAAREAIQKLMDSEKKPVDKYIAVKEEFKKAMDEKEITNKIGIEEKNLDEFFKVLQNMEVRAGGKKLIKVKRMQEIAADPVRAEYLKNKLGVEYERALATLNLMNDLKIKRPSNGSVIVWQKPVWMKKYERILLNK